MVIVSNITFAGQVMTVATASAHGLATGDPARCYGFGGMPELDEIQPTVTVIDSTTLSIDWDDIGLTRPTEWLGGGMIGAVDVTPCWRPQFWLLDEQPGWTGPAGIGDLNLARLIDGRGTSAMFSVPGDTFTLASPFATVDAIVITDHNLTATATVRIRAHDSAGDAVDIVVPAHEDAQDFDVDPTRDNRRIKRNAWRLIRLAVRVVADSLTVEINDPDNTDGNIHMSQLLAVNSVRFDVDGAGGWDWGWTINPVDDLLIDLSADGVPHSHRARRRQRWELTISIGNVYDETILRAMTPHRPIAIQHKRDNPMSRYWTTIIGYIVQSPQITRPAAGVQASIMIEESKNEPA